MIIHGENPKDPQKSYQTMLFKHIYTSSINRNLFQFYKQITKKSEIKTKRAFPFITATNSMTFLGINLTKDVQHLNTEIIAFSGHHSFIFFFQLN